MVQVSGGETAVSEDVVDRLLLRMTDFDGDKAVRLKQGSQGTRELSESIKTIPAAIQADGGIVRAHFRRKRGDFRRWNIRRIGNDDVEPSCQRPNPTPGNECCPVGKTQASGIGRCNPAGCRRDVDSDSRGSRQSMEQGKE